MSLAAGHRLGPYEIVSLLGEGGMGTVYRARDSRLGRDVAIKTIRDLAVGSEEALARFEREVRAVAALSHPNVVVIHDVGVDEGMPFAVSELLRGETLRDRLRRSVVPPAEAIRLGLAVAQGLAAAHAVGIVHRDLKPSNVFLGEDGQIKVLDFGLAILAGDVAGSAEVTRSRITRTGAVLGTVDYMSPEQARGSPADARSDVFSLGCLLHTMIGGRPPFSRRSEAETLAALLGEEPASLPAAVPAFLVRLVARCLDKDPSRRFATAHDVQIALEAVEGPAVRADATGSMDSLAVLPFADLSPSRDQDYFCDGLTDELISALMRIDELRVASRTSCFQWKGASVDVREIGRVLGVRSVLEGSVRQSGGRLRITVQLTDVAQGFALSSESYDRAPGDIIEVQEDIARRVVAALQIRLTERERHTLARPPTGNARAYDFYLRGRGLFRQYRVALVLEALELFRAAATADPEFALAHAARAEACSWLQPVQGRAGRYLTEALSASERALELRPDLVEVRVARGVALALSSDTEGAERSYRAAIDQNPRLFEAYYAYGRTCLEQGRVTEAAGLFEKAAALAPDDFQSPSLLAMSYSSLGRPEMARLWDERAVAAARQHLQRCPQDVRAVHFIGLACIRLGEVDRGLEWVERARHMDPRDGVMLYNVACAYALAGRTDEALDGLEEALDHAIANRDWIANDPDFVALRDHPRFRALLDRLG